MLIELFQGVGLHILDGVKNLSFGLGDFIVVTREFVFGSSGGQEVLRQNLRPVVPPVEEERVPAGIA